MENYCSRNAAFPSPLPPPFRFPPLPLFSPSFPSSPFLSPLHSPFSPLPIHSQSINQSINFYRAIVQRRVLQCGYAESKRNVLRRIFNVLTDGAVRQFSGREFRSVGAATEKRRVAVSKLCGGTDRNFCMDDRSKGD